MNSIQKALSNCNARKLYHKDIYMPLEYINQVNDLLYNCKGYIFSKHLKNQCNSNYKHEFDLRELNKILNNLDSTIKNGFGLFIQVFEIETQWGRINKFCLRIKQENRDYCIDLMPIDNNKILVKTVWRNKNNDFHSTLDITKYEIK